MDKKKYMKPTMKIVKLQHSMLICTSDGGDAYIPAMDRDDMNKLA